MGKLSWTVFRFKCGISQLQPIPESFVPSPNYPVERAFGLGKMISSDRSCSVECRLTDVKEFSWEESSVVGSLDSPLVPQSFLGPEFFVILGLIGYCICKRCYH